MDKVPISPPEAVFRQMNLDAFAHRLKNEVPTSRALSVRIQSLRGRELDTAHIGESFPSDTGWERLDQYRELLSLQFKMIYV